MTRFDRYLLSQLMVYFGFFALILVMVYWVNRAVLLFDQLIADGQSATVFLEFTALTLPNVIRVVLPIAAFAASVYATNRLSSESELVVAQAMGFSGFRMARPVLAFGLIVALLTSILSHFLVPISSGILSERSAQIRENITARFLTEGRFLHPTRGITFYIREISPEGELLDVFMNDNRDPESTTTYTAKNAFLVREENGPKLVMLDGMAQTLKRSENRLYTTGFSDFAYDIGALIKIGKRSGRESSELSTLELLSATPELQQETGRTKAQMLYEGHERFAQPALAIVAALIGFSTLIVGTFSRFGVMRQILAAIVILVIIRAVDSVMISLAIADQRLWWLVYVPVVLGLVIAAILLWLSERPGFFARLFGKFRRTA
ncbi:MAG TPA: LPS export ABC transporter permease LptF [Rhodobacteraceae bacterium]|nr:LPS export ABC transporter permease LptF [Paracoccaceae bacterium]